MKPRVVLTVLMDGQFECSRRKRDVWLPSTDPESICDAVREEVRYGYCDVHELSLVRWPEGVNSYMQASFYSLPLPSLCVTLTRALVTLLMLSNGCKDKSSVGWDRRTSSSDGSDWDICELTHFIARQSRVAAINNCYSSRTPLYG
jgi:hypothetical protein